MSKHNRYSAPFTTSTESAEKTLHPDNHLTGYIECPGFTGVYLRTGEGTDHDPITILSPMQRLRVIDYGANWSKVTLENNTDIIGYVQTKFICVEKSAI